MLQPMAPAIPGKAPASGPCLLPEPQCHTPEQPLGTAGAGPGTLWEQAPPGCASLTVPGAQGLENSGGSRGGRGRGSPAAEMCQRKVTAILVVLSNPATIPGEPCPALQRQTALARQWLGRAWQVQADAVVLAAGPCFCGRTWSNLPRFSPHSPCACRAGSRKQCTLEKSPSSLLPVPPPASCPLSVSPTLTWCLAPCPLSAPLPAQCPTSGQCSGQGQPSHPTAALPGLVARATHWPGALTSGPPSP